MTITVRRFTAVEWPMYRDIRLRALLDSPDAFGSTYEREAGRSEADWQARLIEWARKLGVRALRLGVTPSHPAALRLYRRAGFVDAGEPAPLRPGSSVMCRPMELSLDAGAPNRSA